MLHQVIAATSNNGTAATGGGAIGTFIVVNVARAIWRQTRVTLPDGRRVTRSEQIALRKWQYAVNRAAARAWQAEQKRAKRA